jgi:hypothetical protein
MRQVLLTISVLGLAGLLGSSSSAQDTTTTRTFYTHIHRAFVSSLTPADGSAHTILAVTVTVPAAGTAAIDVNTQLWTDFPPSAESTLFATVTLGRCSAPDTFASTACPSYDMYHMQKPPNNTSESDITEPFSLSALLIFAKAGTKTFYLNAEATGSPGGLYNGAYAQIAYTPKDPVPTTSTIKVALFP